MKHSSRRRNPSRKRSSFMRKKSIDRQHSTNRTRGRRRSLSYTDNNPSSVPEPSDYIATLL